MQGSWRPLSGGLHTGCRGFPEAFPSGDLRRGSCDVREGWVTRSGLRRIEVPPFTILPTACGDARATFALQFVCAKTANQLRCSITGVACVDGCKKWWRYVELGARDLEKFVRRDAETNRGETAWWCCPRPVAVGVRKQESCGGIREVQLGAVVAVRWRRSRGGGCRGHGVGWSEAWAGRVGYEAEGRSGGRRWKGYVSLKISKGWLAGDKQGCWRALERQEHRDGAKPARKRGWCTELRALRKSSAAAREEREAAKKIVRGKRAHMAGKPDAMGITSSWALGGGVNNAAIFRHSFKELGLQKFGQRKRRHTELKDYRRQPYKCVDGSRRAHSVHDKE